MENGFFRALLSVLFTISVPDDIIEIIRNIMKRQQIEYSIEEIYKHNYLRCFFVDVTRRYLKKMKLVPVTLLELANRQLELPEECIIVTEESLMKHWESSTKDLQVQHTGKPKIKGLKEWDISSEDKSYLVECLDRIDKESKVDIFQKFGIRPGPKKVRKKPDFIGNIESSKKLGVGASATVYRREEKALRLPKKDDEMNIRELEIIFYVQTKLSEQGCAMTPGRWYLVEKKMVTVKSTVRGEPKKVEPIIVQEMEVCPYSLENKIDEKRGLDVSEKVRWLKEEILPRSFKIYLRLLNAGIPHGDLKTNNVMFLKEHQEIGCIDFDLITKAVQSKERESWGTLLYADLFLAIDTMLQTLDPEGYRFFKRLTEYLENKKYYKNIQSHATWFVEWVLCEHFIIKFFSERLHKKSPEIAKVYDRIIQFIKDKRAQEIRRSCSLLGEDTIIRGVWLEGYYESSIQAA